MLMYVFPLHLRFCVFTYLLLITVTHNFQRNLICFRCRNTFRKFVILCLHVLITLLPCTCTCLGHMFKWVVLMYMYSYYRSTANVVATYMCNTICWYMYIIAIVLGFFKTIFYWYTYFSSTCMLYKYTW